MQNFADWEVIIGLEIHAALNTNSKLFSRAPNRFGDEPNTNITDVCTGQPGSLPVLNKEAIYKAVRLGCALNGKVANFSKFDRKSYFYPDSPRNFQITQYDEPIILGGSVIAEVEGEEKTFTIHHVHLEDDAGMLKHFENFAGVDYNRAGVPLVEIVSDPCIHSPKEAVAYAMAVRAILQYIDASNCNMQEGSLRFDVNVSVRKKGEKEFRNKIEIKNLNSFFNMDKAIEAEVERQIFAYTQHPNKDPNEVITQSTFRWDPDEKKTILMREKEFAKDYRYFPEPDLVPIILSNEYIEEVRQSLPELPREREKRYSSQLNLKPDDAFFLASDKAVADYFDEALQSCTNPRSVYNWIVVEFAGRLKESGKSLPETGIPAKNIATLVNLIDQGTITGKIAKTIADEMLSNPTKELEEIIREGKHVPVTDTAEIEKIIDEVLAQNQKSVIDYKEGKLRAFGFLVGQVMKLTGGKASPQIVNEMLKQKLEK